MRRCYFCKNPYTKIDYKELETLRPYLTPQGKIAPSRRSHVCTKHQRQLGRAIKRARLLALLPFTRR